MATWWAQEEATVVLETEICRLQDDLAEFSRSGTS